jgi:hypothetical protein
MMILARWIDHPLDAAIECPHHADAREHRRDQNQGFHKGKLPLAGQPWSSHSKCLRDESRADVGIPSTGLMIVSRKIRHADKPGER